jgi:hypothetical protein
MPDELETAVSYLAIFDFFFIQLSIYKICVRWFEWTRWDKTKQIGGTQRHNAILTSFVCALRTAYTPTICQHWHWPSQDQGQSIKLIFLLGGRNRPSTGFVAARLQTQICLQIKPRSSEDESWWESRSENLHEYFVNSHALVKRGWARVEESREARISTRVLSMTLLH